MCWGCSLAHGIWDNSAILLSKEDCSNWQPGSAGVCNCRHCHRSHLWLRKNMGQGRLNQM
jgi:hypothetical protein